MSTSNTFGWVIGVVVVVIAGLVFWWGSSTGFTFRYSPEAQTVATSTDSSKDESARVVVETRSSSTVAQIVASVSNANTFNAYMAQTGIAAQITGKGPYTVFVATDGAFNRLSPGTLAAMTSADLKRMMQYHVVVGRTLDIDAVSSGNIQALSKDMLNFDLRLSDGMVLVNSAKIITQYKAKNGIVYVLNTVLLPPQKAQQ